MARKLQLTACLLFVAVSVLAAHAQKSAPLTRHLKFSTEPVLLPMSFQRSTPKDPYLAKLRTKYGLDRLVAAKASDYDKVRVLTKWVRTRWEHNGSNEPSRPDPISILEEAEQGKQFRCVEYSVVLAAALNSVGIPARVLGLMTEDADTRESGAGHVVTEAYLADSQRWIMIDGQWDAIPTLNGKPINAVQFQQALASRSRKLALDTLSPSDPDAYFAWIAPYLYYFHTALDSRYPSPEYRDRLFLAPIGAKSLTVFQRRHPIGSALFINSLPAFYARPDSLYANPGWL